MPTPPSIHQWLKQQGFFNSPLHPFIAAALFLHAAALLYVVSDPLTALHTISSLNCLGFALFFTAVTLLCTRLRLDTSLTSLLLSTAAGLWLGTLLKGASSPVTSPSSPATPTRSYVQQRDPESEHAQIHGA